MDLYNIRLKPTITKYSPIVIFNNKINNINNQSVSGFINNITPQNNRQNNRDITIIKTKTVESKLNLETNNIELNSEKNNELKNLQREKFEIDSNKRELKKEINNIDLIKYVMNNNTDNIINNKNYLFEHIYIISLLKCINKRERCIHQLLKHNITNYEFFEGIDTVNSNLYNCLYEKVISNFDKNFIQNNFQKGALGCLLSHLNVLKDAKQKGYKSILILEDDFLISNDFNEEYLKVEKNIPNVWDFIYFGKKQGKSTILKINKYIYKPNSFTYATHAICIKNTIYDDLINRYNTLEAPVDLLIMGLYEKYNFYVLYNDLFITSFDSDIRITTKQKELELWNWDLTKYFQIDKLKIKNIIIWGMNKINHTHHYIHNMYYEFFKYYYNDINIIWCSNNEIYDLNFEYSIFFVSPSHGDYSNLPYNDKSLYIFHLDDFNDNIGLNMNSFSSTKNYKKIIEENRGIILLARENITDLKYFDKMIEKNTICLPWFSNKKFNDIINIKNNCEDIFERNKKGEYYCYFGSVWYLNINEIIDLINCCHSNKKKLLISGRFLKDSLQYIKSTQPNDFLEIEPFYNANKHLLSVHQDSFERLNDKYGVSAFFPIQGKEHNDNYLSNRLLENICEGYVGFSNNMIVNRLFKNVYYHDNISELVKYISKLLNDKEKYCSILNNQIDEILTNYYGYKIIDNLIHFLQNIFLKNNSYFSFNTSQDKPYKLLFTKNSRPSYVIINNIESLSCVCHTKNNYIIKEHLYDVFILDKIIRNLNYDIVIDKNYKYKKLLIFICNKYKKKYSIKKPIKVYCLFSHQRTGSTLIVDYIQKTSKKIFALSEIFGNFYDLSYDITNQNGILYNYNLILLNKNGTNIKEYINQFINIAEDRGYEGLFFKCTFDIINENIELSNLNLIINNIKKYNIIYLDRNDIDIFISKKLANKNNTLSNEVYINKLNNDEFKLTELYTFLNNKHKFLNTYLSQFNKIKYINYEFIKEGDHFNNIIYINNLLNGFYNDCYVKYLIYEKYYEYYDIFNKKQNKFDNNELINK
jgi:GR25 family glycosyltransferase involved in LPS biosynthesis